jgi:hypothetical protein
MELLQVVMLYPCPNFVLLGNPRTQKRRVRATHQLSCSGLPWPPTASSHSYIARSVSCFSLGGKEISSRLRSKRSHRLSLGSTCTILLPAGSYKRKWMSAGLFRCGGEISAATKLCSECASKR